MHLRKITFLISNFQLGNGLEILARLEAGDQLVSYCTNSDKKNQGVEGDINRVCQGERGSSETEIDIIS